MRHLISLTDMGLTIVASIHQPRQEIFDSFNQVLILSEGYQMFRAPPGYVLHWFHNILEFPYDMSIDGTVADWLITIVSISFSKGKDAKKRCFAHSSWTKTIDYLPWLASPKFKEI